MTEDDGANAYREKQMIDFLPLLPLQFAEKFT